MISLYPAALQTYRVTKYLFQQKLKRKRQFPLVLMLEPLFRCNLTCKGCGKIQHPEEILSKYLSLAECVRAVEECGAPVVSIAGGEPLIHPEMPEIVAEMLRRKKVVYLCTNGILLKQKLDLFKPHPALYLSFHLDGLERRHDDVVRRKGVFRIVIEAIQEAKRRGFNVTTNTTLFTDDNPKDVADFFDLLTDLKVDGMMVSPGYAFERAAAQDKFIQREAVATFFNEIFACKKKKWKFNHSPFFIDFLRGKRNYSCSAWGNPNFSILGWQKPCYLLTDGYVDSFDKLMKQTPWAQYGVGVNDRCANCMVHCGYEPSAVLDAVSSPRKMIESAKRILFQ